MADIFKGLSYLRMILDTETDFDSTVGEELKSQIRENIEALLILLAGTGVSGSATSDPPNDTTGVLTDTAQSFTADSHNGKTLVMTSGLAKGNAYTIDDTTATTLVCTGDNLYADGVRSGDSYLVLYDVKTNTDGHDHNGVNSKEVVLAKGRVPVHIQPYISDSAAQFQKSTLTWARLDSDRYNGNMEIYVPVGAAYLIGRFEWLGNTGYTCYFRHQLGGQYSAQDSYYSSGNWRTIELSIDVSSLSPGWYTWQIEGSGGGTNLNIKCRQWSLMWSPTT